MICYESGTFGLYLLKIRGEVLSVTLPFAVLVGLAALLFKYIEDNEGPAGFFPTIFKSKEAYVAYNVLVFFLIQHRTNGSHSRFVTGTQLSQDFQQRLMNAGSLLFAYSHHSKASAEMIDSYHSRWMRLLSLLHAVGISKLHGSKSRPIALEIIDVEGLDEATQKTLWGDSTTQFELVMNWMQASSVKGIDDGVLVIAPPIAAQVWLNLTKAYDAYMRALRLVEVPYPFPYVQLTEILIVIHCIVTPIVMCGFTFTPGWSALFAGLIAWIMLSINKIASRVTDPYGRTSDALDLDVLQKGFNSRLILLGLPSTRKVPTLSARAKLVHVGKVMSSSVLSMVHVGGRVGEPVSELRSRTLPPPPTTSQPTTLPPPPFASAQDFDSLHRSAGSRKGRQEHAGQTAGFCKWLVKSATGPV